MELGGFPFRSVRGVVYLQMGRNRPNLTDTDRVFAFIDNMS